MSVIAEIFVRHDFYELDNYQKSEMFVKQAIDQVKQVLSIDESYDHFSIGGDTMMKTTSGPIFNLIYHF